MTPLSLFKCLSDDTRLNLVLLLDAYDELCVCDFVTTLALSQPKISRHLADLRKCDIVSDERRGKWVYYRLHPELPDWVKAVIAQASAHKSDETEAALARLKSATTCQGE